MPDGIGTGFVIDSGGLVLTNNHVVGRFTDVTVTLFDRDNVRGTVLGRHYDKDIAIIKVDAGTTLPTLPLGDSAKVLSGSDIWAIGYAQGLRGEATVTRGIVSASRKYNQTSYIQIDAAINPGNSGGPLINTAGEVVGINNFRLAESEGMGLALAINEVKPFLNSLARGASFGTAPTQIPASRPYFQGKTVTLVVDSPAGRGSDTMARIVALSMAKHIPGNPNISIRNRLGTALGATNKAFYETAKPDGLTLILNDESAIRLQQERSNSIGYDLTKYKTIGNISRPGSIVAVRRETRDRLTNPSAQPVRIAASEDSWQAMLLWGKEFLAWNVQWIPGFGGQAETELAFRRGQLEVFASPNAFILRRMNQEGLVQNLGVVGVYKNGTFSRQADSPSIPTFVELMGNRRPGGLPWQAYMAWTGPSLIDYLLSAPPGTPESTMTI